MRQICQKHILVIEDDRALNEGIAFALGREGYTVHRAYSLKEAKSCLKQRMNLILLDINLPEVDDLAFGEAFLQVSPCLCFF